MTIEIWTGAAWAKGGYGGWAEVRIAGGEAVGVAGGERATLPYRMSMTAAIKALEAVAGAPAAPVLIYTLNRDLLAREKPPEVQETDLWTAIEALLAKRTGSVRFAEGGLSPEAKARAAFVDGWASFALDIARTKGLFSAVIPKHNLATLMAKR